MAQLYIVEKIKLLLFDVYEKIITFEKISLPNFGNKINKWR
jgi:hypothetical protein